MSGANITVRTDGAAVECPTCLAVFGGMDFCPWDGTELRPLADADPTAVAFYAAVKVERSPSPLDVVGRLGSSGHLSADLREHEDCGYHDSNERSSL